MVGHPNRVLVGTSQDYVKVSSLGLSQGRFFTEIENSTDRHVIMIDDKIAAALFGTGNQAAGKTVKLNSQPFLVVGVAKPEAPTMGMEFEYSYIPINAMLALDNTKELQQLLVRVYQKEQLQPTIRQTVKILEMRHDIEEGYQADTNEQLMKQINTILTMITSVVGALAGIALVVGGIGIMNIMLVSVTERTREIGIRIAVGARRRDILIQCLVESAVISVLGGIVGMILGIGIGALISVCLPVLGSDRDWVQTVSCQSGIATGSHRCPALRINRKLMPGTTVIQFSNIRA